MAKRSHKAHKKHRNAAGGNSARPRNGRISRAAKRARQTVTRIVKERPPLALGDVAASATSTVVGSAISGVAITAKAVPPWVAAAGMIAVGGTAAFVAGGAWRAAGSGLFSAGLGQATLAMLAHAASRMRPKAKDTEQKTEAAPQVATAAPLQLPAPPAPPQERPQSADGGNYVVDMFRDASRDLAGMFDDDEWRRDGDMFGYDDYDYGARDTDPRDYVEIDLDGAP